MIAIRIDSTVTYRRESVTFTGRVLAIDDTTQRTLVKYVCMGETRQQMLGVEFLTVEAVVEEGV